MLSRLVQKTAIRFAFSHSFYAPQTLEYPINQSEESYQKNRELMDQVNTQFLKVMKEVKV